MSAEKFEIWMRLGGYREATILTGVRSMRRLERGLPSHGLPEADRAVLRRYLAYLQDVGPESDFDEAVLQLGLEPATARPKAQQGRKREARSFRPRDWEALWHAVENPEEPEDCVLEVQMVTGYRIGDILRITRKGLHEAFKGGVLAVEIKGGDTRKLPIEGAPETWARLRDQWDEGATLADWICPAGERGAQGGWGAYKRVQRRLYALGAQLDLEPPVHLHRLRRTVAVNALRQTKDIHLVSQLLGHKSIQSTQTYVDEARLAEIGELQRKLRGES